MFSDRIPSKLQEYPHTIALMDVFDKVQEYKIEFISEYIRNTNAALCLKTKWLLKKLADFGINDLPLDYPIAIMQQLLLNIDTICRTRGSKIGVQLYCSILSLGEVVVDDSEFWQSFRLLLLDSQTQGFITEDNTKEFFYLCADNGDIEHKAKLRITIKSKYFNGDYPNEAQIIKSYIEKTIESQLSFTSAEKEVIFDYQPREGFYYHKLLNKYFV